MCRRPVGRMPLMTRFVFDSDPVAKLPFLARHPFGVRRSCRRFDRVMVRDLASPFDTGDEAYTAKAGARLPHSKAHRLKPVLLGRVPRSSGQTKTRPYNVVIASTGVQQCCTPTNLNRAR